MTIIGSLPNRPLDRAEVDSLDESERFGGVFPVYGEEPGYRDVAIGVVLELNGSLKALAYDSEWIVVGERELDSEVTAGGVHFDEHAKIDELQGAIVDQIDAL